MAFTPTILYDWLISPVVDLLKFDDEYLAVSHLRTLSVLLHVDLRSHHLLLYSDIQCDQDNLQSSLHFVSHI